MTNIWNQENVPHKGWQLTGYEELEQADHTCEMCGQEEIRYVHHMSHPQGLVRAVGCVCAEKMTDDYQEKIKIQEQDRWLKSRAQKRRTFEREREKWITESWKSLPISSSTFTFKQTNKIQAVIKKGYGRWRFDYAIKIQNQIFTGHSMFEQTARAHVEDFVEKYKFILPD